MLERLDLYSRVLLCLTFLHIGGLLQWPNSLQLPVILDQTLCSQYWVMCFLPPYRSGNNMTNSMRVHQFITLTSPSPLPSPLISAHQQRPELHWHPFTIRASKLPAIPRFISFLIYEHLKCSLKIHILSICSSQRYLTGFKPKKNPKRICRLIMPYIVLNAGRRHLVRNWME